ncbi:hypothetical protein ADUPG1_010213, partial [Aduncisulcus paluster]
TGCQLSQYVSTCKTKIPYSFLKHEKELDLGDSPTLDSQYDSTRSKAYFSLRASPFSLISLCAGGCSCGNIFFDPNIYTPEISSMQQIEQFLKKNEEEKNAMARQEDDIIDLSQNALNKQLLSHFSVADSLWAFVRTGFTCELWVPPYHQDKIQQDDEEEEKDGEKDHGDEIEDESFQRPDSYPFFFRDFKTNRFNLTEKTMSEFPVPFYSEYSELSPPTSPSSEPPRLSLSDLCFGISDNSLSWHPWELRWKEHLPDHEAEKSHSRLPLAISCPLPPSLTSHLRPEFCRIFEHLHSHHFAPYSLEEHLTTLYEGISPDNIEVGCDSDGETLQVGLNITPKKFMRQQNIGHSRQSIGTQAKVWIQSTKSLFDDGKFGEEEGEEDQEKLTDVKDKSTSKSPISPSQSHLDQVKSFHFHNNDLWSSSSLSPLISTSIICSILTSLAKMIPSYFMILQPFIYHPFQHPKITKGKYLTACPELSFFGLILTRLFLGYYQSVLGVFRDLGLIYINSIRFNGPGILSDRIGECVRICVSDLCAMCGTSDIQIKEKEMDAEDEFDKEKVLQFSGSVNELAREFSQVSTTLEYIESIVGDIFPPSEKVQGEAESKEKNDEMKHELYAEKDAKPSEDGSKGSGIGIGKKDEFEIGQIYYSEEEQEEEISESQDDEPLFVPSDEEHEPGEHICDQASQDHILTDEDLQTMCRRHSIRSSVIKAQFIVDSEEEEEGEVGKDEAEDLGKRRSSRSSTQQIDFSHFDI